MALGLAAFMASSLRRFSGSTVLASCSSAASLMRSPSTPSETTSISFSTSRSASPPPLEAMVTSTSTPPAGAAAEASSKRRPPPASAARTSSTVMSSSATPVEAARPATKTPPSNESTVTSGRLISNGCGMTRLAIAISSAAVAALKKTKIWSTDPESQASPVNITAGLFLRRLPMPCLGCKQAVLPFLLTRRTPPPATGSAIHRDRRWTSLSLSGHSAKRPSHMGLRDRQRGLLRCACETIMSVLRPASRVSKTCCFEAESHGAVDATPSHPAIRHSPLEACWMTTCCWAAAAEAAGARRARARARGRRSCMTVYRGG